MLTEGKHLIGEQRHHRCFAPLNMTMLDVESTDESSEPALSC
jgi:hypothetical protein